MNNFSLPKRNGKTMNALALRNRFSPFGNKLVEAGYVTPEDMEKAITKKKESGVSLTEALKQITQRELPPALQQQYKRQHLFELKILYGIESLDPEVQPLDDNEMGSLIGSVVPFDVCRHYKLLPLSRQDGEPPAIVVAMVDPENLQAIDELGRLLRDKNLELRRIVITEEDYDSLLDQYQQAQNLKDVAQEEAAKKKQLDQLVDVSGIVEDLDRLEENADDFDDGDDLASVTEAHEAPVIKLVNRILIRALSEKASDIHIEPQEDALRVRFRKDGVLNEVFSLPKKVVNAVAARFKIMADLDIAERRMPQDGKIRRLFEGRKVDFRVNCLPSRYGEKVVLRILDNSATQLGLDVLITHGPSLELVRAMAARPFGLILVTGPTGSGKSTTLYSILAERNSPGVNISTVEDPIEYSLPGITQVQVIREKGMDFASILRAFLRQDPDIILVGETRDKETAKTAIEAALTGHLVLTTLHTNDAAGAIARLDEMGVEPFMVSGSLIGVLAQRLMRRVCSDCRIPYSPTPEELARYGLSSSGADQLTVYRANTLDNEAISAAAEQGTLCPTCNGSGYKGRCGVYEVMQNSERLSELINSGGTTDRIKEVAVEEGMITLLAYSLDLVREGYTTFEEVERVTFTDAGLEAELKAKRKSSLTCATCAAELQPEWMDCPYCTTPRFSN
ncbi:MAG: ATPase, T2SS/T4P/T4SS family [Cyanobacteria bacterium P01_H01_bin.15]